MPPSIYTKDGTPLLEQPGSSITLVFTASRSFVDGLEISIVREMNVAMEIIEAPTGHENWSRMVAVRTYAKQRM